MSERLDYIMENGNDEQSVHFGGLMKEFHKSMDNNTNLLSTAIKYCNDNQ